MTLAIPESQLQELKLAAAHDPVLQALNKTIQLGWPDFKSILPKVVHCYFDVHDELTVQDELVFKRAQIAKTNDEICPQITHWHRRLCTQS